MEERVKIRRRSSSDPQTFDVLDRGDDDICVAFGVVALPSTALTTTRSGVVLSLMTSPSLRSCASRAFKRDCLG